MARNPDVLETLMIVPGPRTRIARPAAAPRISTARIITSIPCSCGPKSSAVSLARMPKPALLTKRSTGCSALASRAATRWTSSGTARSALIVSTATP